MRDSICNDCAQRTRCDMAEIGRSPLAISTCYCYEKGNPSNADRIRAMTDEELAEWFHRIQYDVSDYYCGGHSCEPTLPTGKESWLGWLKQEAKCTSG